jgi:carbon-monoxide dehydrogenase iron sulfur subunit
MKRIFIDREKCDGCKNCSFACMQAHREKPGSVYDLDLLDKANESRNVIRLDGRGGYLPIFCRHCAEPDCVAACMSGALRKDPLTGHVQYDADRCGKCFMCVMNCPYGNIKPDVLTGTRIVKCDFCKQDDENPNCVKSCPRKAIHVEEVYWSEVSL